MRDVCRLKTPRKACFFSKTLDLVMLISLAADPILPTVRAAFLASCLLVLFDSVLVAKPAILKYMCALFSLIYQLCDCNVI